MLAAFGEISQFLDIDADRASHPHRDQTTAIAVGQAEMQMGFAELWHEMGLLIGSPAKGEFAGVTIGVTGEDLTQDTMRMDVTKAVEIKRKRSSPSLLLGLKELTQFVGTAATRQRGIPDMDLASLQVGAIFARPFCSGSSARPKRYDGRRWRRSCPRSKAQSCAPLARIFDDRGYRGHNQSSFSAPRARIGQRSTT